MIGNGFQVSTKRRFMVACEKWKDQPTILIVGNWKDNLGSVPGSLFIITHNDSDLLRRVGRVLNHEFEI